MRRRLFIAAALAIVAVTSACTIPKWMLKEGASTGGNRDQNLITSTELMNSGFTDLYDAVNKLRPHFITGVRGISGQTIAPTYFFNGSKSSGGAPDMRNYQVINVLEVRFIRPTDAKGKYGDDATYGVVEVRTK